MNTAFIERLTSEHRDELFEHCVSRSYPRGATLFSEGDEANELFFVIEGQIKIAVGSNDGREVLLELRGSGEVIGEMALLDRSQRSASAVALSSPTDVLVLESKAFQQLLDTEVWFVRGLLEELVSKVRDGSAQQLEFGLDDVAGRVARRLLELGSRLGTEGDEGTAFRSPITQQELADWSGVSRQAVVKELSRFRRNGWVLTQGSQFVLADTTELERLAAQLSGS